MEAEYKTYLSKLMKYLDINFAQPNTDNAVEMNEEMEKFIESTCIQLFSANIEPGIAAEIFARRVGLERITHIH